MQSVNSVRDGALLAQQIGHLPESDEAERELSFHIYTRKYIIRCGSARARRRVQLTVQRVVVISLAFRV